MKFYQELTLIPCDEISQHAIWSKIFMQVHIALAELQSKVDGQFIGISFPNYRYSHRHDDFVTLGYKLRVFAPSFELLTLLDLPTWLGRLDDYVHIKSIERIDEDRPLRHVVVKRHRQTNLNTQAKNFAKHKGIDFDEAFKHCQTHKRQTRAYPYITLKSQTNGHNYHVSIEQKFVQKPTHQGTFNSYGMSNATNEISVPHW